MDSNFFLLETLSDYSSLLHKLRYASCTRQLWPIMVNAGELC